MAQRPVPEVLLAGEGPLAPRTLQQVPVEALARRHLVVDALRRWIYALPKGALAEHGEILRSKRTSRSPRRRLGERKAPIIGMTSIDATAEEINECPEPPWDTAPHEKYSPNSSTTPLPPRLDTKVIRD